MKTTEETKMKNVEVSRSVFPARQGERKSPTVSTVGYLDNTNQVP
jgi:hypothetical protein